MLIVPRVDCFPYSRRQNCYPPYERVNDSGYTSLACYTITTTYLEHVWRRRGGEVHRVHHVDLHAVLRHESVHHDRLSRALLPDQQHGLMLLRDRVDQEVRPYVVDIRNEDRVVVGRRVGRVVVVVHVRLPHVNNDNEKSS